MSRHYKKNKTALIAIEAIASRIVVLRGQRVMLDADLAALYGVTTKRLNEQVRRNLERFPSDFMFQLANQEVAILRSQFATLRAGHGQHRKYLPSVYVVRAFVELRDTLVAHKELTKRLDELESRLERKLAQRARSFFLPSSIYRRDATHLKIYQAHTPPQTTHCKAKVMAPMPSSRRRAPNAIR
jgi:ORF6N domain-containing protein